MHGLGNGCYKRDVDYLGHDVNNGHQTLADSAKECQQLCEKHPECVAFSWISANVPEGPFKERERECWLKHTEPNGTPRQYVVSGPKLCGKFDLSNIQYFWAMYILLNIGLLFVFIELKCTLLIFQGQNQGCTLSKIRDLRIFRSLRCR